MDRRTDGVLRPNGLGDRADLVDFEQQAVAGLFVHCLLDPLGIGHGQVVTYDLMGHCLSSSGQADVAV